MKTPIGIDVLSAARSRIAYVFDHFDRICISFSGGKDSSAMFHLVMDEAKKRRRRVGVLLIDLEAQYELTIKHAEQMFGLYRDLIDLHWVCLPIRLRNAISNYEPTWTAWEPGREPDWVRQKPIHDGVISDPMFLPFFESGMEFEEFVELFGEWYGGGRLTACFVGIRADESLNRYRTVAMSGKETYFGMKWTTKVCDDVYNAYPIYDWDVSDIWRYHAKHPDRPHNEVYDRMHMAGLSPHQMRLCQPYGDDQKRGIWLYHLIEPQTWARVVARVSGVNGGSLYIGESGNMTGRNRITLPAGHTWESFCKLLLSTMPTKTREHYVGKFKGWISGWISRGYVNGIPDVAPPELEKKMWAPSWRRLCKVLLRNDWWCKGLGLTQPRSEAYGRYMEIKKQRKEKAGAM